MMATDGRSSASTTNDEGREIVTNCMAVVTVGKEDCTLNAGVVGAPVAALTGASMTVTNASSFARGEST